VGCIQHIVQNIILIYITIMSLGTVSTQCIQLYVQVDTTFLQYMVT